MSGRLAIRTPTSSPTPWATRPPGRGRHLAHPRRRPRRRLGRGRGWSSRLEEGGEGLMSVLMNAHLPLVPPQATLSPSPCFKYATTRPSSPPTLSSGTPPPPTARGTRIQGSAAGRRGGGGGSACSAPSLTVSSPSVEAEGDRLRLEGGGAAAACGDSVSAVIAEDTRVACHTRRCACMCSNALPHACGTRCAGRRAAEGECENNFFVWSRFFHPAADCTLVTTGQWKPPLSNH